MWTILNILPLFTLYIATWCKAELVDNYNLGYSPIVMYKNKTWNKDQIIRSDWNCAEIYLVLCDQTSIYILLKLGNYSVLIPCNYIEDEQESLRKKVLLRIIRTVLNWITLYESNWIFKGPARSLRRGRWDKVRNPPTSLHIEIMINSRLNKFGASIYIVTCDFDVTLF